MKINLRFLAFSISTACFMCLNAQTPPNGGFEQWNSTSDKNPTGWASLNWTAVQFGAPYTCARAIDAHSGNYAVKLSTMLYFTDTIDGLMFTGDWPSSGYPLFGYPYNRRPLKLTGYYKFSTSSGDSSLIAMWLTRWNDTTYSQDTIGNASFYGKAAANYTYFELPITYYKGGKPDSATIVILGSSKSTINVRGNPGNTLYIDDLAYEYSTGIREEIFPELAIYPNPSNGIFHMENLDGGPITVRILDLYGKEILVSEMPGDAGDIDVTSLADGMYTVAVLSGNMSKSFKIVKAAME